MARHSFEILEPKTLLAGAIACLNTTAHFNSLITVCEGPDSLVDFDLCCLFAMAGATVEKVDHLSCAISYNCSQSNPGIYGILANNPHLRLCDLNLTVTDVDFTSLIAIQQTHQQTIDSAIQGFLDNVLTNP